MYCGGERLKSGRVRLAFFAVLGLAFSFGLTGCLDKDSEIYGQQEVLEYVDTICEEPYHLVGSELVEESPDNMEYSFETDNRELTFQANSYLSPIYIDATQTGFYNREISCNYVNVVHDLYRDELQQVLRADSHYLEEYGWIYLLSFADIDRVIDTIMAADRVYRQELAYNSEEFLAEYPLSSVHLVWQRSDEEAWEHKTWVNITDVGINGQHDRDELYDRLANVYAQLCVDGEIEKSGDVPEQYLADKHVSLLTTIEVNGEEMLYDDNDNPYGPYGLTTDDYKYCWYSEEQESYMMVMDIGLVSDGMSFPLIIREYVRALGGTYQAAEEESKEGSKEEEDIYRSSWAIGENTWTMEAEFADNVILNLAIEKNGVPLDIPYVTSEEDYQVSATFCVGVTVENFCQLFDLRYTVDENAGVVRFAEDL